MKLIKTCPESEETLSRLGLYHSEEGKAVSLEVSGDENKIEDSIVLRKENIYPDGYGLVVISSKIDDRIKSKIENKQIVLLGLSNYSKEDIELLEANRIRYFTMRKTMELSLSEVCDLVMESSISFEKLCLSVNLDCLDSAFYAGGIPGGMTTRELIYMIQRLKRMKNLRTAEICGGDPDIAAKLVKELS